MNISYKFHPLYLLESFEHAQNLSTDKADTNRYHRTFEDHKVGIINYYIIYKHLLIGPDAYPLESIKLHITWFAGRDVAKHTAQGNIAWLTGSDVRTSSYFAESIRNVNGLNGIK